MTEIAPALPSLRREINRTLTWIGGVWLLVVFCTMAVGIRHEVDELMDDALQEAAQMLQVALDRHGLGLPQAGGDSPTAGEHLVWQIVDQQQRVVARSRNAPELPLLRTFNPGLSDGPASWRIHASRLAATDQVLLVGQPGAERFESRYEVIAIVGASGLAAGIVCALWVRRRVGAAMQPLRQLSEQIEGYDPMRPPTDLPPPARLEFVEIRAAIVDLGRRLARRVEHEQAFAAHAAHALRTPLAGMDAQLAIAMKEASGDARQRLERTREAVARLKRVVTSLLALFRSSATPQLEDVDIADLLSRLPADGLVVNVSQDRPLRADPNLLAAALVNLLDNAARHGARTVSISCRSQRGCQRLTLVDDGPGVTPQRLEALQRSLDEPVDATFAGLGLKLAALIARTHNGKLLIDGGRQETGGFSVTMVFGLD